MCVQGWVGVLEKNRVPPADRLQMPPKPSNSFMTWPSCTGRSSASPALLRPPSDSTLYILSCLRNSLVEDPPELLATGSSDALACVVCHFPRVFWCWSFLFPISREPLVPELGRKGGVKTVQGGPGLLGQLIVINTGNTAALCLKPPASDAKSSLRPSGPWGRQTRLQRNGRGEWLALFLHLRFPHLLCVGP